MGNKLVVRNVMKMTNTKRFLTIALIFGFISCNNKDTILTPKNLNEAISYFENNWSKEEKYEFVKDSLHNAHFTVGRWIRNNWIHGQRDTSLVHYFNSLGIYHPDDISSIILTSLYRKLNNLPIELDKQIEIYKSYWKPIIECENRERRLAWENYQKLKIGNQIMIYMEVDTSDGEENVIGRTCPYLEWNFDSRKDVKLTGLITDKYFINDTANVFIKVKIQKMNKDSIKGLINITKTGVIENFEMKSLKYEIIK